MKAEFLVREVEQTTEGEYNGILSDGRLITATVGTGVLSIEVENPEKNAGGRHYIGHAEPMREIFVKAIAPEEYADVLGAAGPHERVYHLAGEVCEPRAQRGGRRGGGY